jgi:hypothetical protein
MRNKLAAIAATVLLAGGVLATAPAASAAPLHPRSSNWWDHTWTTKDSAHGGTVYVRENDDIVDLCDTAADGYAPRIHVSYQTPDSYQYLYGLTASGGNGSCVEATATDGGAFNLPENTNIEVEIWLGPNGPENGLDTTHGYYLNDH